MIEKIIEYSIRNRFIVLILAMALVVWGVYAVLDTPVDAIPDLSENQVIVFTDWMGRSPREIEDQVTYPLSRKLQGLAGVRTIRSSSEFNFSMITIIFEDGVDFYFARQRVTEKLSQANTYLPNGVVPYMAPDATALGQIFWYTVEPSPSNPQDPAKLWALNKFYIVPQLTAAAGVAEVATVGGAPLEYQIDVKPELLRGYGITLSELYGAVSRSNQPAGGGVVQKNNAEFIVRGVGWIKDKRDIENTVVKEIGGIPIYIRQVATVQLGTQFRRSVFEKDGSEVVGGVVLMRHGGNPLAVTEQVKEKIQELQPGLPPGVRIVPAYDRTRLIHGAIGTLTQVMWHEMLIASVAVLLILMHLRSVFVICVTLPLSVLFSFLLMWLLRHLGIIDIQANIMSLAGITISIGILVDQAIVMTENATHHLKDKFGTEPVKGDIREFVIPACRMVGRPIFFSVLIMLVSFIPVFMLSGREGKYFHPLAFTKSFAMIGVALLSVTVVPALIPTFLKGKLKSEEDNWIVRSFINIYKPLLTWFLPRRNLVMWMFAALLIVAAGIFPIQAVLGLGASESAWQTMFLVVFAVVTALTVLFTRGWFWQVLALVTLVTLGMWAYHIDKKHRIGVEFMPPLDEGSIMDMPVTVPRASVTEVADDLKHRDGLLRGFPEVESVIGKAGRADTPTDPSPLEMVETFINFRPHELWPKRVLKITDALEQSGRTLKLLEERGYVSPVTTDRDDFLNKATQLALVRFDEVMREQSLLRYQEFERELSSLMSRFTLQETLRRMQAARVLHAHPDDLKRWVEQQSAQIEMDYGPWLARHPSLEDVTRLTRELAVRLLEAGYVDDAAAALALPNPFQWHRLRYIVGLLILAGIVALVAVFGRWQWALGAGVTGSVVLVVVFVILGWLSKDHGAYLLDQANLLVGGKPANFSTEVLKAVDRERTRLWRERVKRIDWELFDVGVQTYVWYALEEIAQAARNQAWTTEAKEGKVTEQFAADAIHAQLGHATRPEIQRQFVALLDELTPIFSKRVFFWQRRGGKNGDLVQDEMDERVIRVPGWPNTFTMPIINRIDMLSSGVRTDIGVKVFGPNLDTVDSISKDIEAALKPVSGASNVLAWPIKGKSYLEIDIDREKAARYGISVEDIQNEIEVALGGRVVTYTVEKRERFPVRIRYVRTSREDEANVRRLLVAPGIAKNTSMGANDMPASPSMTMASPSNQVAEKDNPHQASPGHAGTNRRLIPLAALADVRIVEGPAMIKSENGLLMNTVTLYVIGRDTLGFVDEAQRVVAQKVHLPEGVSIAWTGEFEHQMRAARTLRFVFPAVIVFIFIILYLTYNDFADASLMMLAVPEALAGGAFFLWLFPKILHGWDSTPMNFSVAVWVGFIACFGMATETGIIMLVYLREAIEKRGGLANLTSLDELREAVIEGAVHRLRPKLLTEGVALIAIFPMVFTQGVGGEILAPMALPVLGGLLIADEVVDIFLPVRFYWVRRARWLKLQEEKDVAPIAGE